MANSETKGLSESLRRAEKGSDSSRVRLNKYLADEGIASRRSADKIIEEGRITINGKKVYELGIKVDPKTDKILFDGRPIRKNTHGRVVAMFHKPKGVLTTTDDPLGRPTITDFIRHLPFRLFPVGRLDWDSEGLLLLTNDGDFAQKVMHPSSEISKTYLVKVNGIPKAEELAKLRSGVSIVGGRVKALAASKFSKGDSRKYSWIKIVITEGKNRQIRQMMLKIGYDVIKLQRIAIGRLRLGALPKGQIVYLAEKAVEQIFTPVYTTSSPVPASKPVALSSKSTSAVSSPKFKKLQRKRTDKRSQQKAPSHLFD